MDGITVAMDSRFFKAFSMNSLTWNIFDIIIYKKLSMIYMIYIYKILYHSKITAVETTNHVIYFVDTYYWKK